MMDKKVVMAVVKFTCQKLPGLHQILTHVRDWER